MARPSGSVGAPCLLGGSPIGGRGVAANGSYPTVGSKPSARHGILVPMAPAAVDGGVGPPHWSGLLGGRSTAPEEPAPGSPPRSRTRSFLASPGDRPRRSARLRAVEYSIPLFFTGAAALALGLYALFGPVAFFAGRVPIWVLLTSVSSVLLVGGVVSSLTDDELEGFGVDPADIGSENVLVPRQEWLDWKRDRLEPSGGRNSLSAIPSATWTASRPTEGLMTAATPPVPISPTESGGPWGETPTDRATNSHDLAAPPRRAAASLPAQSPMEALDGLLGSLEALRNEQPPADSSTTDPRKSKPIRPPSSIGRPAREPKSSPEEVPVRSLRDRRANAGAVSRSIGTTGPGTPPPNPRTRGAEDRSTAPGETVAVAPSPPRKLLDSFLTRRTSSSGLSGPSPRLLRTNPCVGCGSRLTQGVVQRCESCELVLCAACQQRGRREGHPRLCPTCAMLLRDAGGS